MNETALFAAALTWNEVETNGAQRKEIKRRIVVLQHLVFFSDCCLL